MTDKKTRATPDTSGGLENLLGDLTGEILAIADFFLKTVLGTPNAQQAFDALAPRFAGQYPQHKMLTDLLIEQEYLSVEA